MLSCWLKEMFAPLCTSSLWIQFRSFFYRQTHNCAGCYFTWARAYGLVIMLRLEQNSNELHPQESWMCLHWKRSSGITDSSLPVSCRWPEKWNLSTQCGLLTHVQSGPRTNQRAQIAGEVPVAPLLFVENFKMEASDRQVTAQHTVLHPSCIGLPMSGGGDLNAKSQMSAPRYIVHQQCWGRPQSSWMILNTYDYKRPNSIS